MAGPRQLVDPPTFTPSPYGLLSVVDMPTPPDIHWLNGVTYRSYCATGSTTYDECITVTGTGGPPPAPHSLTSNVVSENRGATPFTVYAEFDCSPVGNADAAKTAQDALARVEGQQVEEAFWTGQSGGITGVFPHLAADAVVTDAQLITLQTAAVTGSAADIAAGLGFLEDQLGSCYGGVGVIHVPMLAVPTLDAWGLLKTRGARLYTANGNVVAAGVGYTGTGPTGAAATSGSVWLYGTGAVFAYRSPMQVIQPGEGIDRAENTIRMIAQRTYVLGWECCHVAVEVALGVPT